MAFPWNVYTLALASAGLCSLVSLPVWRAWCIRVGLVDDPGHRKIHSAPIPLAGGFAVLSGIVLPLACGVALLHWHGLGAGSAQPIIYGIGRRATQLAALAMGAFGMVLLGAWDDKRELRALPKFVGQFLIAGMVAASGVRITLFVPNVVFSYAVTVLWILTVTNAVNFMDNMNGLCAGMGMIAAACFGLGAASSGQYLVALLAFVVSGALLGFLPYNFPRASAFLGDAGSHLVGYLLAVLAILPHFYSRTHPSSLAVLKPLLILAVPLGDLVWVVVLRWRLGQPVYVGDNNHLSHRLVRRGYSRTLAVLLIWLLTAITGVFAVAPRSAFGFWRETRTSSR